MAERYGMLPTELLSRATTSDIFIFDIAAKWRRLVDQRAQGQQSRSVPKHKQSELQAMLDAVRQNHGH